jgi:hypothetical protein
VAELLYLLRLSSQQLQQLAVASCCNSFTTAATASPQQLQQLRCCEAAAVVAERLMASRCMELAAGSRRCQYLYFYASKASKLSSQ